MFQVAVVILLGLGVWNLLVIANALEMIRDHLGEIREQLEKRIPLNL